MAKYELVVILDPFLQDPEYTALTERIQELITRRGGEIVNVDVWGRRRMAYSIAKKEEGYYVVFTFEGNLTDAAIAEIERAHRLNESVLRHMVTRLPAAKPPRRDKKERKAGRAQSATENYQGGERRQETHSAGQAGAASSGPLE